MTEIAEPRVEGGKYCIDLRLKSARQLFDGRDPAPFRDRVLDADAVEYMLLRLHEIPARAEAKIVVWIANPLPSDLTDELIVDSFSRHFHYEGERLARQTRMYLQRGPLLLIGGLAVIILSPTISQWMITATQPGNLQRILTDGISIMSWVAVWRPLETLVYDWWPLFAQRRTIRKILETEIEVRHEVGPASVRPPPPAKK